MTTDVVTVDRITPFKEIVTMMLEHRVSAVPVHPRLRVGASDDPALGFEGLRLRERDALGAPSVQRHNAIGAAAPVLPCTRGQVPAGHSPLRLARRSPQLATNGILAMKTTPATHGPLRCAPTAALCLGRHARLCFPRWAA